MEMDFLQMKEILIPTLPEHRICDGVLTLVICGMAIVSRTFLMKKWIIMEMDGLIASTRGC